MTKNPFSFINARKPTGEASRHARMASQNRAKTHFSASQAVLVAVVIFLFVPLFSVVLFSFNAGKGGEWTGFSLEWYRKLIFDSIDLWEALANSLIVAISAASVAAIIGSAAALGTAWYRFRFKRYIHVVSFLPMVLPEVIVGVSMLVFFARIKVPLGLFTIFAAHATFCLPFVFLLVSARLDEFDFSIVEAAYDLGANEAQTMFKVVIPSLMPGIAAAFLLAVTMSLEDFVITFFVSGPGSTTLPLYIYSMIRFGVSPVINALSFLMILLTTAFAFFGRRFLKFFAASK